MKLLQQKYLPITVTFGLFLLMFAFGSIRYTGFFSPQVFLNLFIDNSFLIIAAVGMTFVILSGGIDLSVGAVIALTTMVIASLLNSGFSPWVVLLIALLVGPLLGFVMGCLIHYFNIQPFIVTLAGMFLARGLSYVISIDTIIINNRLFEYMANTRIYLGEYFVSFSVLIALIVVIFAFYLAHYTKFGRNVYALGGSEQSALLMGIPVGKTKIAIYAFNGLCSSIAGVVFSFYMLSGYGLHAMGMELDVIASVVIGGTLLTGGSGYVLGSVLGVLILGVIQTLIVFEGTLSSWWTKIAIGILLLLFIIFQRGSVLKSVSQRSSIS